MSTPKVGPCHARAMSLGVVTQRLSTRARRVLPRSGPTGPTHGWISNLSRRCQIGSRNIPSPSSISVWPSRGCGTFGLGQSILTAGLTLALLILPIVITTTREALRAIPQHVREGAYACGASQWQVTADHLLPYSTPGILTGVIIGLSRAIGETAPIITIGALTFIAFLPPVPFMGEQPAGLFDWLFSPFTVMPIQIFNWTSRPEAAFQQNAAAASFVLVFMTLGMNAIAIWLRYRLRKNINW